MARETAPLAGRGPSVARHRVNGLNALRSVVVCSHDLLLRELAVKIAGPFGVALILFGCGGTGLNAGAESVEWYSQRPDGDLESLGDVQCNRAANFASAASNVAGCRNEIRNAAHALGADLVVISSEQIGTGDCDNCVVFFGTAYRYRGGPTRSGGSTAGGEDLGRPAEQPQSVQGFVEVQGRRVPAMQLRLEQMTATVMRDPASDDFYLFHVRPISPGQVQGCASLEITGAGQTVRTPLATDAPESTYRVDAAQLRGALAGDALAIRACERVTWLSRPQREGLIALLDESSTPATEVPSTALVVRPDSSGAEQVRAMLDARRGVLLACAGRDVVGIRASWNASGALRVSLQPPLAGGSEEECVRSQLSGAHVDGAVAGEVVHVLSR